MPPKESPTRDKTGWKAWKLELLGLFGSFLSFTAMVVLLAVFNGRPIFEWEGVTLNAIISTLSVSMKASFTFAIAELIGQWKWILLSRDAQPLFDFERIDMASRGPLGSVRVLFKRNSSSPLRLGASLIVLAIALDPFSQQLLQLQPGIQFSGPESHGYTATVTPYTEQATRYDGGDIYITNKTKSQQPGNVVVTVATNLELSMQTAILNGVSRSKHMVKQQSTARCPTGTCTWPRFQTLGVCHRCTDLSQYLKKNGNFAKVYAALVYGDADFVTWAEIVNSKVNATGFVLPNGHFLVDEDGTNIAGWYYYLSNGLFMSSFGTGDPKRTNSMQDIDTLIWSMSFIHPHMENGELPDGGGEIWPDVPISALECAIYYCVKAVYLKVDGNIIDENATELADAKRDPSSWSPSLPVNDQNYAPENIPPKDEMGSLEFNELYSHVSRSDLILHFPDNSSKPEYSTDDTSVWSINHFIRQLFSTNITGGVNLTALISEVLPNNSAGYNGLIKGQKSTPPALGNMWSDKLDIPNTFSTLATSITNEMRRWANERVLGRKGIPTKYYHTKWGWIVLHGMMLIGGALFFCVTVWNRDSCLSGIPTWKNSALAVLSQGPIAGAILKGTDLVVEMEKRARKRKVKIARDHGSTDFRMREENDGETYLMQEVNL